MKNIHFINSVLFVFLLSTVLYSAGDVRTYRQFPPVIPGMTELMMTPDFWIEKLKNPDEILDSEAEIRQRIRLHQNTRDGLENLSRHPLFLSSKEVMFLIDDAGQVSKSIRFHEGKTVEAGFYDAMLKNRNIDAVCDTNQVYFGLTVKRAEMRSFPSDKKIYSSPDDVDFERLLTAVLYALEPVVIIHESADSEWYLAKSAFFTSWIRKEAVAVGNRLEVLSYQKEEPFIVITGKKVFTGVDPFDGRLSEFPLDMGMRIPLAKRHQILSEVDGRIPDGNLVVRMPVRNHDGSLDFRLALIQRTDDFSIGYLPYTRRNIVNQAFKFLGQRYGWGGLYNTRDCSAYLKDVLATMGVILPRNSRFQGQIAPGKTWSIPKDIALDEKIGILDSVPPVSPVYMSGHVMLYLGKHESDYYIIHDSSSLRVKNWAREVKEYTMMGVNVTPLLSTYLSSGKPYIDALYAAREFVLD